MSKLLFNEQPLVVDKQLAKLIGLNEAMVLQQIHYWIEINKKVRNNYREDKYWTYNTIQEWQNEFPFWSYDTVKRTLAKLRKQGILITGNFNKLKIDRTIWYTINYDVLEKLNIEHEEKKNEENKKEEIIDDNDEITPVDNHVEDENKLNEEADTIIEDENIKPLETLKFPISADCSNGKNPISAKCPNAKGQNASMQKGNLPSPLPEISTETSTEISNQSISQSIGSNNKNIQPKIDGQTDIPNKQMDNYNHIIKDCELDSIDESFRDAVSHAIKLLFLDIENKKRIKIGENIIPSEIVGNDLMKLNFFVIEHAINKFKEASRGTEIRNKVAYLKTCIYNSIHEMGVDVDSELRYVGAIY